MTYLYFSTDSFEAEGFIDLDGLREHDYYDFDINDGKKLAGRIGFNPMSSVKIKDGASENIKEIVDKFVRSGIFVAVESNGTIDKYMPSYMDFRNEMVKLSLQKERDMQYIPDAAFFLLLYSNNPNKIMENIPFRYL